MKRLLRILLPLLILTLGQNAWSAVSAQLDRTSVAPGESVQLTLQRDDRSDSQPDLTPLKQDFDILGRSSGSSIQIINGTMSVQNQITLVLAPKHSGTLTIPALHWGSETTTPLTLTVAAGTGSGPAATGGGNANAPVTATVPAGNSAPVFITATTDQKQPYVQAAVTLTVRLYTDEPLYQASLELQPSNDVLIQQLGQDHQTTVSRDGRDFQMVERKYLLFPQRSGKLRLDGPVLNAQVQDGQAANPFANDPFFSRMMGGNPFGGMLGSTKPIRVRGQPIVLDVRPRPASGTGHDWLPAQKVTLDETWQPSGPIHVGDPLTRHLHLSALGLTGSQLPNLSQIMPLPKGIRVYPDQAKLNTAVQGGSVIGSRDQDIALIADRAGRYRIPPLRLYWWDTTRNLQREVQLPARTIDVLPASPGFSAATTPPSGAAGAPPAASSINVAPPPTTDSREIRWRWVSLALGTLWLATLAAWLIGRRRGAAAPTSVPKAADSPTPIAPAAGRKAFREACRGNDPQTARSHLLAWARATWPQDPPLGLGTLARRLDDAELAPLLAELDRACYSGGEWRNANLLEKLKLTAREARPKERAGAELAQLYP